MSTHIQRDGSWRKVKSESRHEDAVVRSLAYLPVSLNATVAADREPRIRGEN
jgi:hypothetical protein